MIGAIISTSALIATSFAPNVYVICAVFGVFGGMELTFSVILSFSQSSAVLN